MIPTWVNQPALRGGGGGPSAEPLVLPGTPAVINSLVRVDGYLGPSVRVRRVSDDAEQDIGWSNNLPDIVEAASFAEDSELRIVTWYDQSGNGNDATQATAARQPSFPLTDIWNIQRTPIVFDGWPASSNNKYLQITEVSGLNRLSSSIFVVCSPTDSLNNRDYYTAKNSGGSTVMVLRTATQAGILGFNGTNNQTVLHPRTIPSVFAMTSANATTRIYCRGTSQNFVASVSSNAADGIFQIGRDTNSFLGDYWALIIYTTAQNQVTCEGIIATLEDAFNIPTTFSRRLVFAGDSIMEGYNASPYNLNTPRQLQRLGFIPSDVEVFNMAISGWTIANASNSTAAESLITTGDILWTNIGTNSMTSAEGMATTLYNGAYTTLMNKYLATGATIFGGTLLPKSAFSSGQGQIEWETFNSLVVANTAGINVMDVQSDPTMGPRLAYQDTSLYLDNLHPTPLGHEYLAQFAGPILFP